MDNQRPSPKGKIVSLFVTCMVDMLYPQTGMSTVEILEHLGCKVVFPMEQTCCGQPAFNAGYRQDARKVALQFIKAFKDAEAIVSPSGSCTAMVRHEYPKLFAGDPKLLAEVQRLASITWELTEFIVDGLGISNLHASLPEATSIAFHDSCHGLRQLGLGRQARTLVGNIENVMLHELEGHDECCGFGGLFSVKMEAVSGAMLKEKMVNILNCPADFVLCGDVSCMAHMNGGLSRRREKARVTHIADLLAAGLKKAS